MEHEHRIVGTVTAYFDSAIGLPADEAYREELDALRRDNRTPAEVGHLTIASDFKHERSVLIALLESSSKKEVFKTLFGREQEPEDGARMIVSGSQISLMEG